MHHPTRLVLASASPRRRELLGALGIAFEVLPGTADETLPPGVESTRALQQVALRKARDVARRLDPDRWVLAADTAVIVEDRVFGKPAHREEAEQMLRSMSAREHAVTTAVGLLGPRVCRTLAVTTRVRFRALSETQIRWYASLHEPYDKAGGYAIQGQGAFLVERIEGSYTNVVGLPMSEVVDLLEEHGLVAWRSTAARAAALGEVASG